MDPLTHTCLDAKHYFLPNNGIQCGGTTRVERVREQCIYNVTTDQFNLSQSHCHTQVLCGNSGSDDEIQWVVGNVMSGGDGRGGEGSGLGKIQQDLSFCQVRVSERKFYPIKPSISNSFCFRFLFIYFYF